MGTILHVMRPRDRPVRPALPAGPEDAAVPAWRRCFFAVARAYGWNPPRPPAEAGQAAAETVDG